MIPLRICLVAENASTTLGGEAIIPFHYFRILRARGLDAHLVVHERVRSELISLFPDDLDRIHFVPDKLLQKLFYRIGRLFPRRIAETTFGLANQLLTQSAQRPIIRKLATANTVVHQPIPVSPRFPSLLWNVGAPVIIGPLNGGMEYPAAFRQSESTFSRATIAFARSFTNLINAILPGKKRAAVILVANQRTAVALPKPLQGRIIELPENAVDLTQWQPTPIPAATNNFTFIGRLVDWKALDTVLEALRLTPAATLDVIGDGPMRSAWQALANRQGLTNRVTFHGWLPQTTCAQHLRQSLALVLPSLYECGGAVVLEALATARPVIATAWGGPTDYLDATCGILLPPASREALVNGFAHAMQQLIDSPKTAATLGQAGRQRVLTHFDWEKKVDALLKIYDSALPTTRP